MIRSRRFAFALAFVLTVLWAVPSQAQEAQSDTASADTAFTLEAIHNSSAFSPQPFQGGRWAEEGPIVTYIESAEDEDGQSITHLISYNLQTGERSRLINGENLYANDVERLIQIEDYQYSRDRTKVLIFTDTERVWRLNTKGYYYVYDIEDDRLTPVADRDEGYQMFAKFNPAADKVGFVRNRDLFVVNLNTMNETALTSDGSEGGIINGTFDWVYEEEFGLRDGWRWSPDGRRIAFFKLDESDTREFAMTDYRTRYPTYERFRYPKAGEQNSEIKIGVIDVSAPQDSTLYFDTNTWNEGGERYEYIARMDWTPEIDGQHRVWMFRLNRDQNTVDLLYGHPETGAVDSVLQLQQDTYIDIQEGVGPRADKLYYLDDGAHFVLLAQRTGYTHLHLYENDGTYLGPITDGEWEVAAFQGIDEANNQAYFTATRDSSIERQLYRVGFEMGAHDTAQEPEKITEEEGWHEIDMSRDLRYYIDTYSSITTPPTTTLHRADGEQLAVLQSNQDLAEHLEGLDLPTPEFTSVPGADSTALNAYVLKPTDFDASKEYPVLMYVYGGPGAQTVTNRWGGSRHLWHLYLVKNYDVVVVSVDNRGTGGRGKAFQDIPYQQLGQPEAADQIAAAQHFAQMDWVDADRIGIWGWSYGGYMTLLSMLMGDGPDTFDMGIAVAPVTDWRLYDTIYTERYMSTPQKNPEGYKQGAPLNYAGNLSADQDLLLVHGDFDDNVHYQNSVQMIDTLQAAGKQFDFMVYPGKAHGIAGGETRLHLFRMMTEYLEENLLATEPEPMTAR